MSTNGEAEDEDGRYSSGLSDSEDEGGAAAAGGSCCQELLPRAIPCDRCDGPRGRLCQCRCAPAGTAGPPTWPPVLSVHLDWVHIVSLDVLIPHFLLLKGWTLVSDPGPRDWVHNVV
jgi:hypothetical protein